MVGNITNQIAKIASVGRFDRDKAGHFVGCPFALDFQHVDVLVADSWKLKDKGSPQGCFLLAPTTLN